MKPPLGNRILLLFATAFALATVASAQSAQLGGIIIGRSGSSMTVQTQDGGRVKVRLSDDTQVIEPEGLFRKKHLALTALIPGPPVKVKGSYDAQNQLHAGENPPEQRTGGRRLRPIGPQASPSVPLLQQQNAGSANWGPFRGEKLQSSSSAE